MKVFRVISFLLFFIPFAAIGQKIQYSRQTFPYSFADATQLVTDVGGYHHVLRFKMNNKPAIHIFNSGLEYTGQVDVDISVEEGSDIRIVPMQGHYYLYFHTPGSPVHSIYRITSDGTILDKTPALEKIKDSSLLKSTVTYQLQNYENQLCILSNSYYEEIKKIGTTVLVLDEDWSIAKQATVFYSFRKGKETLQQVIFNNSQLVVLKTGIDQEKGNTLEVIKTDIRSGISVIKSFTAETHLYTNAALVYAQEDSSLVVHAAMREEGILRRSLQPTFIARLNHQLTEVKPFTLYRVPPKKNIVAGFLLVDGEKPVWVSPQGQPVLRFARNQTQDFRGTSLYEQNLQITTNALRVDESEITHGQPSSVRFTVLNEKDKPIGDTTVENNGSYYDLQPRPNAQFYIGNKACLLFLQNFSAKQKGLVLVYADKSGHVTTTPVPVFDRNEYLLQQTQAKKDYFLLPYQYKKEMGLVKVALSINEK